MDFGKAHFKLATLEISHWEIVKRFTVKSNEFENLQYIYKEIGPHKCSLDPVHYNCVNAA